MNTDATGKVRLLDLSRLVSRVGRGTWTGIDRVEAAYLRRLLADDDPLYSIVRSSFGFTLFDRHGTEALAARLRGEVEWGSADLLSRLFLKAHPVKRRAEADLRRLCVGRANRRALPGLLEDKLSAPPVWINVGHSNLQAAMFDAIRRVNGRSVVLIHDTIPLDHPDWQREGTVDSFRARIQQVARKADLVIHSAVATRALTEAQFERAGRVPPGIVAHLGIDRPTANVEEIPPQIRRDRPYLVVLGTIEPRKNHALLLDTWAEMSTQRPADDMPMLYIVGARGWRNDDVFARLDGQPAHVCELGTLSDGALAALLKDAQALLMPSFVEGFGLPPGEALALGCPVIAADLPVYREVFGNNIVYLNPRDQYLWVEELKTFATKNREAQATSLPTWEDHFNVVLKCL
ncbi:MAG: glycosyltransferase family 1 protein [Pseudomonadota bacterium]|nr:glycosyltransferase family 1 protein [Pseudomonadota bacterium]